MGATPADGFEPSRALADTTCRGDEQPGVFRVVGPYPDAAPLLFESPHSGRTYPPDFATALPHTVLRRAEDAHVDELLRAAPAAGAAIMTCDFPRAYVDVNRAEDDLDPELLDATWPRPLRPGTKTALGIGLVRRLVTPEWPIYDRRLTVAEVEARLDNYWRPYRARLEALVREMAATHGRLLVVQWHSMKAVGNAATPDGPGARRPDVVLGDRRGSSAPQALTERVAELFRREGLSVAINDPYAGTEVLERATRLAPGVAALQIELNRALYLDEAAVMPHAGMAELERAVAAVTAGLVAIARAGW